MTGLTAYSIEQTVRPASVISRLARLGCENPQRDIPVLASGGLALTFSGSMISQCP